MIVVSYGTADGVYDRYLERLRESCDAHGMQHDLQVIPASTAQKAYLQKPTFIREMMDKHQQPVVWLDADAVVTRSFSMPDDGWDIGLVPNTQGHRRKDAAVAAFVVVANATDGATSFIRCWEYLCAWPGARADHGPLLLAQKLHMNQYVEIDATPHLERAVTRDFGQEKEMPILKPFDLFVAQKLRGIRRRLRFN